MSTPGRSCPPDGDAALRAVTGLAARLSGTVVVGIALFVLWQAWPVLQAVGPLRFVTDAGWHPLAQPAQFNLLPMLVASVAVTLGAMLLAGPLGLFTAIFMTDYAPPALARLLRGVVELLAGVPSVVYGLWGLVTLVPLLAAWQPPGASLLAGILVLALMILPTMVLAAHAAIAGVAAEHRLTVAALGFSCAGSLWGVLLPAARAGLCGALLLSTTRALGETTGMVKMLADAATDEILGVHIVGPSASELIAEAVVAMEFKASSEDIARICHAHPSLSESTKEAALAVDKRTLNF